MNLYPAVDAKNVKQQELQGLGNKRKQSDNFLPFSKLKRLITSCNEESPEELQKKVKKNNENREQEEGIQTGFLKSTVKKTERSGT